jgi:hypothetical protein
MMKGWRGGPRKQPDREVEATDMRERRMNGRDLCRLVVCAALLLCASPAPGRAHPRLPARTKSDRRAWRKVLAWPRPCEDSFRDLGLDGAGLRFYRLGATRYLAEVTCDLTAYHYSHRYYSYDEARGRRGARPLTMEVITDFGKYRSRYDADEVLGDSTFDRRRKELSIFTKTRGIGDCGSLLKYRFLRGRSKLVEARMQACYDDDRPRATDPRKWARVF